MVPGRHSCGPLHLLWKAVHECRSRSVPSAVLCAEGRAIECFAHAAPGEGITAAGHEALDGASHDAHGALHPCATQRSQGPVFFQTRPPCAAACERRRGGRCRPQDADSRWPHAQDPADGDCATAGTQGRGEGEPLPAPSDRQAVTAARRLLRRNRPGLSTALLCTHQSWQLTSCCREPARYSKRPSTRAFIQHRERRWRRGHR